MKKLVSAVLALLASAVLIQTVLADKQSVRLRFSLTQDPDIYEESDYGEPPTMAIWLEDEQTKSFRSVYVTYRGATGNYYGKVECPVALPVWIGVWRREFSKEGFPTPRDPAPESITGATSLTGEVTAEVEVPKGKKYRYYIEMNVAGDFNRSFPLETEDSRLDYNGNGQPSLIYRGEIMAEPGNRSTPEPCGRTDQHQFTGELIADLAGMDSALECLKKIEVVCLSQ